MTSMRVANLEGYALSLLRFVAGFTFIAHGLQKLFGWFGGRPVTLASTFGAAGIIEVVCGLLIMIGLFTRVAAFIAAGEMAFAYFMVPARGGLWPILNRGELAVLYCFIFLYFAAAGAGPISLDRAVRRKK